MAINIDYLHARNHQSGSVSNRTNTSFVYTRYSGSNWHGAECDITGLTPGKEYKAKFRCSGTHEGLLLALAGTTITNYTFDTTRSQEVGNFTSNELEATFIPVGTIVTALIIQHGSNPYHSFTFSDWEVKSKYELRDNLLEIQSELNEDLELVYDIIGTRPIVLPYIQLEYIQSTGTQYIDTGFKCSRNDDYTFEQECSISNNNYAGANGYMQWKGDITNNTKCTVKVVYKNMQEIIYVNNTQVSSESWSSYNESNKIIGIFRLGNSDSWWTGGNPQSGKLYSFKLWNNNNLVRDFIPVKRKSDNVICLYDKVIQEFFTNAGTGDFIAGPEVI